MNELNIAVSEGGEESFVLGSLWQKTGVRDGGQHREGEAGETRSQGLMREVRVTRKQQWPSLSPFPDPSNSSPWPPFPDYLFQWTFPDPLCVLAGIIWRWGMSFKVVTLEAATGCYCSKYCWKSLRISFPVCISQLGLLKQNVTDWVAWTTDLYFTQLWRIKIWDPGASTVGFLVRILLPGL